MKKLRKVGLTLAALTTLVANAYGGNQVNFGEESDLTLIGSVYDSKIDSLKGIDNMPSNYGVGYKDTFKRIYGEAMDLEGEISGSDSLAIKDKYGSFEGIKNTFQDFANKNNIKLDGVVPQSTNQDKAKSYGQDPNKLTSNIDKSFEERRGKATDYTFNNTNPVFSDSAKADTVSAEVVKMFDDTVKVSTTPIKVVEEDIVRPSFSVGYTQLADLHEKGFPTIDSGAENGLERLNVMDTLFGKLPQEEKVYVADTLFAKDNPLLKINEYKAAVQKNDSLYKNAEGVVAEVEANLKLGTERGARKAIGRLDDLSVEGLATYKVNQANENLFGGKDVEAYKSDKKEEASKIKDEKYGFTPRFGLLGGGLNQANANSSHFGVKLGAQWNDNFSVDAFWIGGKDVPEKIPKSNWQEFNKYSDVSNTVGVMGTGYINKNKDAHSLGIGAGIGYQGLTFMNDQKGSSPAAIAALVYKFDGDKVSVDVGGHAFAGHAFETQRYNKDKKIPIGQIGLDVTLGFKPGLFKK